MKLDNAELLETWEDVFKKGLLSFWLLLLLDSRSCYPFEMKGLVEAFSQHTITADANSIYRALSRFEKLGIVSSEIQPSQSGPDRRYYSLTDKGGDLLGRFIQRNLLIFQNGEIAQKMAAVVEKNGGTQR